MKLGGLVSREEQKDDDEQQKENCVVWKIKYIRSGHWCKKMIKRLFFLSWKKFRSGIVGSRMCDLGVQGNKKYYTESALGSYK